jgi:hypothetical protein
MKYTKMDRQTAKEIHADFDQVCKAFAEARGLTLAPTRCQFSDTGAKLSASFELKENAEGFSGAKMIWDNNARYYGLKPEYFGREFTAQGRVFTISGLRTSARTRPVLATSNGTVYLFRAADIVRKMEPLQKVAAENAVFGSAQA